MIGDNRHEFRQTFHYNQQQEPEMNNNIEILQVTQSDIMIRIHTEFQKPFIKNLYRHLEWQQRVFWAVAGCLQNEYNDIEVDVSLDRIIKGINQYCKEL